VEVVNLGGVWPREVRSAEFDVVVGMNPGWKAKEWASGVQWVDWNWSYINPITGDAEVCNFDGSQDTTYLRGWVSYEFTVNPVDEEWYYDEDTGTWYKYYGDGVQDPLVLILHPGYRMAKSPGSPSYELAWNWLSFPLIPKGSKEAVDVLGFRPSTLVKWDGIGKNWQLYPEDWRMVDTGVGYQMYLLDRSPEVSYMGHEPSDWSVLIPERGAHYIGMPGLVDVPQAEVVVVNNNTGEIRTAVGDFGAVDPWLNWNWVYWENRTYQTLFFGGGAEDTIVRPWKAYYVIANEKPLTVIFHTTP
jgi:hypothetical protein